MSSLDRRQLVPLSHDPNWEQTVPIVHEEKFCCEDVETGFIIYCPPASHEEEDSGQHWVPEEQVLESQS